MIRTHSFLKYIAICLVAAAAFAKEASAQDQLLMVQRHLDLDHEYARFFHATAGDTTEVARIIYMMTPTGWMEYQDLPPLGELDAVTVFTEGGLRNLGGSNSHVVNRLLVTEGVGLFPDTLRFVVPTGHNTRVVRENISIEAVSAEGQGLNQDYAEEVRRFSQIEPIPLEEDHSGAYVGEEESYEKTIGSSYAAGLDAIPDSNSVALSRLNETRFWAKAHGVVEYAVNASMWIALIDPRQGIKERLIKEIVVIEGYQPVVSRFVRNEVNTSVPLADRYEAAALQLVEDINAKGATANSR